MTHFLVIEGLDGSGKTTASRRLAERLEHEFGYEVLLTYEPHNPSCAGSYIRDVLEKKIDRFRHRTLALAYAANRLDHLDREVLPWLEGGERRIVVCDRYYLSSLVYQTQPDFSMDKVMEMNELAIKPDLILFVNVSDEVCYERLQKRNMPRELFDENVDATRRKYVQAIAFLREKRGERIVEIDGNGTVEVVVAGMLAEILRP